VVPKGGAYSAQKVRTRRLRQLEGRTLCGMETQKCGLTTVRHLGSKLSPTMLLRQGYLLIMLLWLLPGTTLLARDLDTLRARVVKIYSDGASSLRACSPLQYRLVTKTLAIAAGTMREIA